MINAYSSSIRSKKYFVVCSWANNSEVNEVSIDGAHKVTFLIKDKDFPVISKN